MNKLYFLLFFIAVVWGAYLVGGHVANEKCRGTVADDIVAQQVELIKIQEVVNAETVSRGVDDIRRILREKYTIAQ